jgi:adenine-specific DNA-methyltransferase
MEFDGRIKDQFARAHTSVVYNGTCLDLLASVPDESIQLVVTSPPYNLGKEYEKKLRLEDYVAQQSEVIAESVRVLRTDGSICWQVGNYVDKGQIIPLDTVLYPLFIKHGLNLRNRVVWHFEHGLHCSRRFSGRYETILWFTKSDQYYFDLDPVRVPQKYPGKKHFKGPHAGKYSGNPLGKNPGDVWIIPNVKSNHVEKTDHPCQFPVELIERLVLSLTAKGQWVLDPFLGTGTSIVAAIRHNRRGVGAEVHGKYVRLAKSRITHEYAGTLRTRPMGRPVYDPAKAGNSLATSPWTEPENKRQQKLLEKKRPYSTR